MKNNEGCYCDPECRMNPRLNNISFQYLYISVRYVVSVQCANLLKVYSVHYALSVQCTLCCECALCCDCEVRTIL